MVCRVGLGSDPSRRGGARQMTCASVEKVPKSRRVEASQKEITNDPNPCICYLYFLDTDVGVRYASGKTKKERQMVHHYLHSFEI